MKSKVISVTQSVNEYGEQKKWGNPEQGLNYDYLVKMEDGTDGIYSSKKEGVQDKFIVGKDTDYEYTPNSNPQFPGKIKPAKKEFTPGGKSFGSDPETRSSIERQTAYKGAVDFNSERSATTFDQVLIDAQKAIEWLQKKPENKEGTYFPDPS